MGAANPLSIGLMRPFTFPKKPLIALALGAGSALGFAPLNWWPLTLLELAALMWMALQAGRLRSVMGLGWMFGIGHFAVGLNWIATAFTFQDTMPVWLGWVAVVALALYIGIYPMLALAGAWTVAALPGWHRTRTTAKVDADRRAKLAKIVPAEMLSRRESGPAIPRDPYAFILLFAGFWIVTEYVRAIAFTGFAWNPLSAILIDKEMAEPAFVGLTRLIGTYGLSGGMVLLAGIWLMAVLPGTKNQRWKRVAIALIAAMLCQILSAMLLRPLPPKVGPQIVVVQPNINQNEKWDKNLQERNFERLAALSGYPTTVPRLLMWPEAATADYLELEPVARDRIARLLGPKDVVLLGGDALEYDRQGVLVGAHNSLFALNGQAQLLARYDKAHLVPYGEYLPARTILSAIGLSRLVPGDIEFWPGAGPASFPIAGWGKVGVQICYEIIFSGQVIDRNNRPDFLFNPSNDAWFGSWGPPQHLAQARLRAVEEGMAVIRSTPTGISAVIDADGRLLDSVPWHRAGAIRTTLPGPHPPTVFSWGQNWLAIAFGLFLIAFGFAVAAKPR